MIWVIGDLSASNDVTPPCANAGTGRDVDDTAIPVNKVVVARHALVVNILDWL